MKHNWEYKRLGEICDILDSQRRPVTKSDRKPGPYPYYGASGVQDYVSDYIFDGDYLLVGEDGAKWGANEKSAFSISGKTWVNNHAHILDFKKSPVSQKFVEYILCGSDLNKIITGTVVPKLTQKNLISVLIPVPPREVQERIVAELDKINETIEDCRELLRNLDALAQSLFYDFFGDPVTNPKGWETSRFGELCKLSAGGDKPFDTQKEISKDFNIPIYSNGIENEGLYGYTSKPRITSPAITISGRGTLGVPFIRLKPFVPIIRLIVAIPSPVVNLTFLFYMIKLLKIGGKGAAIPQLTVPMVKDLLLPVPTLELQEKFAARIEQIEEQKKSVEQTIAELQTLLDSRMDYWFN